MKQIKIMILLVLLSFAPAISHAQQALAPQWLTPAINIQVENGDTISVNPLTAQFTWTPVTLQLHTAPMLRVTYGIRIVRLAPGMPADQGIARAPIIYKRTGLMTSAFTIPTKVLKKEFHEGETYVAEIKSEVHNLPAGMRTESIIQNEGRSALMIFTISNLSK